MLQERGSSQKDEHEFLWEQNLYRVNIVGSAPGWEDAPNDNGYVWAVNNVHLLRDVDLIIDVHSNRINPDIKKDQVHMKVLKSKQIPTYAMDEIEGSTHVKKYPLDEIIEEFDTDYFGCGIDYMIALAIYLGAKEIHIYGVWLALESEYAHQKPTVEFWLGIAKGRGIKVRVHGKKSQIMRTPSGMMYGFHLPQKWVEKYNPDQYELLVEDLGKTAEKYRKKMADREEECRAIMRGEKEFESTDSIESS